MYCNIISEMTDNKENDNSGSSLTKTKAKKSIILKLKNENNQILNEIKEY